MNDQRYRATGTDGMHAASSPPGQSRPGQPGASTGVIKRQPVAIDAHAPTSRASRADQPDANRVFLSPRVLDQGAFDEYASALRKMLDDAARTARDAAQAAGDAAGVRDELTETHARHRSHLEITTKLIKALGAKTDEVRTTIDRVEQRLAEAKELEERVDRIVAERVSEAEQRLAAQTQHLESSIAALVEDRVQATLEMHVRTAMERFTSELEGKVDVERASMLEMLDRFEATRDELAEKLELSASPNVRRLEEICEQAAVLVGWTRAEPDGSDASGDDARPGSLADLVQQAGALRDEAEWAMRRLGSIRDEATQAVEQMGESADASFSIVDGLQKKQQALTAAVTETLDTAGEAERILDDKASRIAQLIAPLAESREQGEKLAAELNGLVSAAKSLVEGGSSHRAQLEQTVNAAQRLLAALEPWRGVLLEGDTDNLPSPLAEIADAFRRDIGKDLTKMASAMHMIASGAETAFRPATKPGATPEVVIKMASPAAAPTAAAEASPTPSG